MIERREKKEEMEEEVNAAREKTNENDGIDFDRDGATLGNRATAPLALPPLSWRH